MVEGTGLENRQTRKRLEGSNPSPSATFVRSRLGSVLLAVFDGLDLDRHRVHDIDDRLHLEFKNRKDAGEIMNVGWLVCLDDHVAAKVADPDHELMDRKTLGHPPIFVEYR